MAIERKFDGWPIGMRRRAGGARPGLAAVWDMLWAMFVTVVFAAVLGLALRGLLWLGGML